MAVHETQPSYTQAVNRVVLDSLATVLFSKTNATNR